MNRKTAIVIPSLNQGKFLEETIQSVLNQDYPELEIFIIDGGSKDNSVEVIKKYESRITGWVSEKDSGQSEAINKGFERCTGEIVTWLCSDDLYTPGTLKMVNEVFNSLPPTVGVIHGNSEIFQGNSVINYDKGYGNWNLERQLAGMTFPQPSAFFRKSVLDKVGLLDERYHFGMDYDLFARMRMISSFHYVDFFFSRYRLHNESKSTIATAKFIGEWIIVFNSIIKGLELNSVIEKLKEFGLSQETNGNTIMFFAQKKGAFHPDIEKLLYYFLVNVIRYDYATEEFKRVRQLGAYLKLHHFELLRNEPSIVKIIRRSNILPPTLLKLARKFKRTLTNK